MAAPKLPAAANDFISHPQPQRSHTHLICRYPETLALPRCLGVAESALPTDPNIMRQLENYHASEKPNLMRYLPRTIRRVETKAIPDKGDIDGMNGDNAEGGSRGDWGQMGAEADAVQDKGGTERAGTATIQRVQTEAIPDKGEERRQYRGVWR